jgi:hypothetical protein
MKTFKSNKKLLIILVAVLTAAALVYGVVHAASLDRSKDGVVHASSMGDLGKDVGGLVSDAVAANEKDGSGSDVVATINGSDVTKNEFDMYKAFTNYNHDYSDKELLDKIIEKTVLFDEATAEGFSVTDNEINAEIEKVRDLIAKDPEQSDFFKNFIDGLGMTEEEYWEKIVFPGYKEVFTINKLSDSLKQKFAEENNITDPAELSSSFRDFYKEYKVDLISKADVQTRIK